MEQGAFKKYRRSVPTEDALLIHRRLLGTVSIVSKLTDIMLVAQVVVRRAPGTACASFASGVLLGVAYNLT